MPEPPSRWQRLKPGFANFPVTSGRWPCEKWEINSMRCRCEHAITRDVSYL
jgi:hypothetical protein